MREREAGKKKRNRQDAKTPRREEPRGMKIKEEPPRRQDAKTEEPRGMKIGARRQDARSRRGPRNAARRFDRYSRVVPVV